MRVSLGGYGSKLRKVSRCRPTVSNETILAPKQEFFFTKETPAQSITDIVLLGFWLMLLPSMFISSYTTICFFVNIFFFSNVYISVNTVFKCSYLCFGWEIAHPLSMYATGGMQRWSSSGWDGGRVENLVIRYVRTKWMVQTNNVKYFFSAVVLSYAIIRI